MGLLFEGTEWLDCTNDHGQLLIIHRLCCVCVLVNCLDRHVEKHPDKAALIWEKNEPEESTHIVTYRYNTNTIWSY